MLLSIHVSETPGYSFNMSLRTLHFYHLMAVIKDIQMYRIQIFVSTLQLIILLKMNRQKQKQK